VRHRRHDGAMTFASCFLAFVMQQPDEDEER
jgi:hypothetical protein